MILEIIDLRKAWTIEESLSNAVLIIPEPRHWVQVQWDDEVLLSHPRTHASPLDSSPGQWVLFPFLNV